MKLIRTLTEAWPFIALFLVTMLVVLWAGLTLQSVFTPQAARQPDPLPSATTAVPSWVKTAPPPLVAAPLPSGPLIAPPKSTPPTPAPSPKVSAVGTTRTNPLPQSRYGHLPYAEASPSRLVNVGTYGNGANQRAELLDQDAADTFTKMKAEASAEGVSLAAISGFRSIADQVKLFERQIQRQGSEAAAARLSAPPGYSEHHTGFALDIGDGTRPNTDFQFEFENTKAYQWLQANSGRYGIELSFPSNNIQGVSFEPWHWRFTRSRYAAAVFAVAHTLTGQAASTDAVP